MSRTEKTMVVVTRAGTYSGRRGGLRLTLPESQARDWIAQRWADAEADVPPGLAPATQAPSVDAEGTEHPGGKVARGKVARSATALLLALGLWSAASAAAYRTNVLASAPQTASGNSAAFSYATASTLVVGVEVTAGSGTISDFDLWLQMSTDGGTTWFDFPADLVLKDNGASGTGNTVTANTRNIVESKTTTAAERFLGVYKVFAPDRLRVKWNLTGTTPSLTFSVWIDNK